MFALCLQLARFIQSKVWKHSHLLSQLKPLGPLPRVQNRQKLRMAQRRTLPESRPEQPMASNFFPCIWNPTPPTKTRHGMCFKKNATKRVHPFTYFRRKRQSPASLTLTFLQDVWGSVLRPNCRNLLESPLQRRPS